MGEKFVGFLDDLRVYDKILTDREVRELFDNSRSIYAGRADTIATTKKMQIYKYLSEDRSLYRGWLQYNPPSQANAVAFPNQILAEGENSTVKTAADELCHAMEDMFHSKPSINASATGPKIVLGTSETSDWVHTHRSTLGLDQVKDDGFVIRVLNDSDGRTIVVAANQPAGVVFGTFDLIRRISLGTDLRRLDVLENPQVRIRMVDHWSNFRGFPHDDWRGSSSKKQKGSRDASIFSWEDLRTGDTKLIRDWVRMLSSCGWNAALS